ncbi:TetR/AcrR family transcriptional regulator [Pleurocapsales cyanobacterium LEGE 10410]|nr:TetR/AcrR family transcriptional regulator [Pleurocapsales cyanobacterium LEGE 10410]
MSKEETVIPKLIPVFRQYGYEGTSLSMLAKATGLGKASLYHHFPQGKEGMATAVMNYIANSFSQAVLQPLNNSDKPDKKIHQMCRGLKEFYNDGKNNCFLAIMSFGEAQSLFGELVKQQLQLWLDTLEKVLIEAGIEPEQAELRSQAAIMEIQGALILVRILNDTAPFERAIANLPEKLFRVPIA